MNEKHGKWRLLIYNLQVLKLIDNPLFLILTLLKICLSGLKNGVFVVIFVNILFDLAIKDNLFTEVLTLIGIWVGVYMCINLFTTWYEEYYRPIAILRISKKLMNKVHNKSMKIRAIDFDHTEFYNDYIWVIREIDSGVIQMIDDLGGLINNIIISISVMGILLTVNYIVVIGVFFSIFVTTVLYTFIIKVSQEHKIALNPYKRKSDYFQRVFYLKQYAKDLRMTEIPELLIKKFSENQSNIRTCIRKYGRKLCTINTLNGLVISGLLDIGIMIVLSYQLMVTKTISVGQFTASSYAIWSLFSSLNGFVYSLSRIPANGLQLQKVITFLEREEEVDLSFDEKKIIVGDIKFDHVFFRYSGKEKYILNDINLTIKKGEKVAIVGTNGAGKSTLIRILLCLYQPEQGEISLNGSNINEMELSQYRKLFGTTFQDYKIYASTLGENVAMDLEYEEADIRTALESLNFFNDMDKEMTMDSKLTKEFDESGTVLSGGQFQRIAIARALVNRDIIILDEPSSALDVIYEQKLNKLLMEQSKDKTLIVISHRLSTTVEMDRIFVLDEGELKEQGSHKELINKNQIYANMFRVQAEKYIG